MHSSIYKQVRNRPIFKIGLFGRSPIILYLHIIYIITVLDEVVNKSGMSAAVTRSNSASGSALMASTDQIDSPGGGSAGERVSLLDPDW